MGLLVKPRTALMSCILGLGLVIAVGCASSDGDGTQRTRDDIQSVSPDPTAGQLIFDANCGACHHAGNHNPQGQTADLAGRRISSRLLSRHHGQSLSPADAADLRAFLAGQ